MFKVKRVMTSDFDNLMAIMQKAIELKSEPYLQVANWLADICIGQANKKKEGWNFEVWKQSGDVYAQLYKDSPFQLKMMFLNECHDVLDHTSWHLKVFTPDTQQLIREIYVAFCEENREIEVMPLKKKFPELPNMLKKIGFSPVDKYGHYWMKEGKL